MNIRKLGLFARLRNQDQDESGTDTLEMESADTGEVDEQEQELVETPDETPEPEEHEVTVGDVPQDEDEKAAPAWVKELRKSNREAQKRLRELENENQRLKGGNQPAQAELKRPKLEDFDFDQDEFDKALDTYIDRKKEEDKREEINRRAADEAQREWALKVDALQEGKKRFNAEKIAEAEAEITSIMSPARQSMLMDIADDPAALVMAIGSNPELLKRIVSIKSDGQAIKEMVKIEMNMKVAPKGKTPPPPEKTVSGSSRGAGNAAAKLDELKSKAQETGNYDDYFEYRRRMKA